MVDVGEHWLEKDFLCVFFLVVVALSVLKLVKVRILPRLHCRATLQYIICKKRQNYTCHANIKLTHVKDFIQLIN